MSSSSKVPPNGDDPGDERNWDEEEGTSSKRGKLKEREKFHVYF